MSLIYKCNSVVEWFTLTSVETEVSERMTELEDKTNNCTYYTSKVCKVMIWMCKIDSWPGQYVAKEVRISNINFGINHQIQWLAKA